MKLYLRLKSAPEFQGLSEKEVQAARRAFALTGPLMPIPDLLCVQFVSLLACVGIGLGTLALVEDYLRDSSLLKVTVYVLAGIIGTGFCGVMVQIFYVRRIRRWMREQAQERHRSGAPN